MNKKLWQKPGQTLHPLIEAYTVGSDYLMDQELILFDLKASLAHLKCLKQIGVVSAKEFLILNLALKELKKDWLKGKIKIKVGDEDCHTLIENYLVKKCGQAAKKIHTGRSRNDQVLVALRLYYKYKIKQIKSSVLPVAKKLLALSKKYHLMPLPGYSHAQQAMLSSVGHYFASVLESLFDDLDFLESIGAYLDKNPLGSAAGFGTSFGLNRNVSAKVLGFAKVQVNSLYCQNSRGKFESILLEGLSQIMMTLGKMATDMLFFTSQELKYFKVGGNLTTGSSIMPQKKNYDFLEILRGNASVVLANHFMVVNLFHNLISGYNRDAQLIKKPVIESFGIILDSLKVVELFLQSVKPNEEIIKSKINMEIFAADIAAEAVKTGVPFRDAYHQAMPKVKNYQFDYAKNIKQKISLGAPGNLGLHIYAKRLKKFNS